MTGAQKRKRDSRTAAIDSGSTLASILVGLRVVAAMSASSMLEGLRAAALTVGCLRGRAV